MKRLTIAELKSQKGVIFTALEAIKGGNTNSCHQQVSGGIVAKTTTPAGVRVN